MVQSANLWVLTASPDEIEAELTARDPNAQRIAEIRRYFGDEEFNELREMAREAEAAPLRAARERVLILPGITGSTLGTRRILLSGTIWLNPLAIAQGRLKELALAGAGDEIEALDVLPLYYLKLKMSLQRRGYDVDYYPYDWRRGVGHLGNELAIWLRQNERRAVSLVCHSMGGLVARMAASKRSLGGDLIRSVIQLGTPNHGSFEPVQVFVARSQTVQYLARADLRHGADELVGSVFNTFPGLYELLPSPQKYSRLDLYDRRLWPGGGRLLDSSRLSEAKQAIQRLPAPDERFRLIAGYRQPTIVDLDESDRWAPVVGDGDGTVPLPFALVEGMPTYYIQETHGRLPQNSSVIDAVHELLAGATKTSLDDAPARTRSTTTRKLPSDGALPLQLNVSDGGALHEAIFPLASKLGQPTEATAASPLPGASVTGGAPLEMAGADLKLKDVEIGRRMHRLDIELINADIAEVKARAYVVGVFEGVRPTAGAIRAIDEALDGAILEAHERRIFSTGAGQVFILPVGSNPLPCEFVVILGLGPFDQFTREVQQSVAENLMRVLHSAGIDEFATVVFGSRAEGSMTESLEGILRGMLEGLRTSRSPHAFRRIVLCELDDQRYVDLRNWLFGSSTRDIFDDTRLVLHELPAPARSAVRSVQCDAVKEAGCAPKFYIVVRALQADGADHVDIEYHVLPSTPKATVFGHRNRFRYSDFERIQAKIVNNNSIAEQAALGRELAKLILGRQLAADVSSLIQEETGEAQTIIIQNDLASKIPWECLNFDGKSPAIDLGISRQLITFQSGFANWSEKRRYEKTLEVLLVVDPTNDLSGAESEGRHIQALQSELPRFRVTPLRRGEATLERVLAELGSGKYDALHYAGHAKFDPVNPSQTGLKLAGKVMLTGDHLNGLGSLPGVVFLNACESARVRNASASQIARPAEQTASLAGSFLHAGVTNLLGTYWVVNDAAALAFARIFYRNLLEGETVGRAVLAGRQELFQMNSVDCWNYINYGDPCFRVKLGDGR